MVDPMQQAFGDNLGFAERHALESIREITPGAWQARCYCGATYARAAKRDALNALSTMHLVPIVNRKRAGGVL